MDTAYFGIERKDLGRNWPYAAVIAKSGDMSFMFERNSAESCTRANKMVNQWVASTKFAPVETWEERRTQDIILRHM